MKSVLSWILVLSMLLVGIGSAVEAQARTKTQYDEEFSRLDRNSDKRLSEQEYVGKKTGEAKERARRDFKNLDRDENKSLSYKEYKRK
ncbi:MAG TPA: hypothetical protein VHD36_06010 [Pirellulales bacterium]|nr:hypothetical protein [Pirellulales bacterium]